MGQTELARQNSNSIDNVVSSNNSVSRGTKCIVGLAYVLSIGMSVGSLAYSNDDSFNIMTASGLMKAMGINYAVCGTAVLAIGGYFSRPHKRSEN